MTFIETFLGVFTAITLSEIAKKIFNRYLDKHTDRLLDQAEVEVKGIAGNVKQWKK